MLKKVFFDTDVLLDVALARNDFVENSKLVLVLAEGNVFQAFTSSLIISNIYYILRKIGGDEKTKAFIRSLLKYVTILSVDQNDLENALESNFSDFEDSIQHSVALRNHCDILVTRNIKDFKQSEISVKKPEELVIMYKELL